MEEDVKLYNTPPFRGNLPPIRFSGNGVIAPVTHRPS